jgi:ubiquinone/menaquinone biosynthesis C-methylase UbiE
VIANPTHVMSLQPEDNVQMSALRSEREIQSAYSSPGVASGYIDRRFVGPLMAQLHQRQVSALNSMLASHAPSDVLEIAPGPGRLTRHINTSAKLTCLEFNSEMIAQAKPACRDDIRWVEGNAFELPFGQEFDCVYSFRFIRHFEEADRRRLYAQIARVLRPGGMLIMDAINKQVSLPLRRARPDEYPIYDKLYQDLQELSQELKSSGFELHSAKPVLRWFRTQSWLQTIVGPRWDGLCRGMIACLEAVPSGAPLEWVVSCRRV